MLKVAIVGKPNVGKSTIFNRLCKRKFAIVNDQPGVTRDTRRYHIINDNLNFLLLDTAGWEYLDDDLEIFNSMRQKSYDAIIESDLILFIVDAKEGISSHDFDFAQKVRKISSNKIVALIANKSENRKKINESDFFSLGFGEPIFISAEHNLGFDDIYNLIKKTNDIYQVTNDRKNIDDNIDSNKLDNLPSADYLPNIAIVGRPNVGKSTIFNAMIGYNRVIVSDIAGTTRDAITENIKLNQKDDIVLIDTAGMRKRNKISSEIENISLGQSITAIRRSNIVLLVVDASFPLEKQDLAIAKIAVNEGKALIVAVNKCDLIDDVKSLKQQIDYLLINNITNISYHSFLMLTAKSGKNINLLPQEIKKVYDSWQKTISTGQLNRWLQNALEDCQPPTGKNNRKISVKYITQKAKGPPTFYLNANYPLPHYYAKYLTKSLAKKFDLYGVPIRLIVKTTNNPYIKK